MQAWCKRIEECEAISNINKEFQGMWSEVKKGMEAAEEAVGFKMPQPE